MPTAAQLWDSFLPPSDDDARWYVMWTKPHRESRVTAHLSARIPQVGVFLPRIEVVRKRAGRRIAALEPLFPGYVFLRMPRSPSVWHAVCWTPGARRILSTGEQAVEMPDEFVHRIRERCEPLGFVRIGQDPSPGDRVRIKTGSFAGLEGIFERRTSRRDRVRVLLQILGSMASLEIDPLDLEKV